MTRKQKTYTREFKLEAIQLAETSGKPVTLIERELGLGKSHIYRWKHQFEREGEEAFPGKGRLKVQEEAIISGVVSRFSVRSVGQHYATL